MNELAHQRLARESELHQAVRRDELRVRYQPQIDLRTGKIVGVEALVRWEHPDARPARARSSSCRSPRSPASSSTSTPGCCGGRPVRPRGGLQDGLPPVRVGVNLSARHFQSPERLIGTIRDALADSGLPAMLLELEVTEGLAITEDESALVLQRIRDMGVSISIDDFGTGYSMLGRLSRFPVDRLKIDRSLRQGDPLRTRRRADRRGDHRHGSVARRSRRSPRASRRSSSRPTCATAAATSPRASCSARRWNPTRSSGC